MHAHVNIWRLSDAGASSSDTVARDVAERLKQQPGFRSYTLVRTGDHEVVAITMFETPAQLHNATQALADFVQENIHHLVEGEPERHVGDVIYHEQA